MDKAFRYRQKHVHDLPVDAGLVRLWDTEGAVNGEMIRAAFRPIFGSGFVWPYVALMPDYHVGEGSMIGSVIPTRETILPSVIGGDVGCGMAAVRLPLAAEQVAAKLRTIGEMLQARIPVGTAQNAAVSERVAAHPIWQREVRSPFLANRIRRKVLHQFGSLGGGNHFLEIQADNEERAWVMLHSGSRFLGSIFRDYYVEQGQQQAGLGAKLFARLPHLHAVTLLADDYLADQQIVIDFARASRKEMMLRAIEVFCTVFRDVKSLDWADLSAGMHDVSHNFVAAEEHFGSKLFLHRKGAVRLIEGQIGLIPGSMGTRSYIVEGRGNPFGFSSCSHGAGRAMSRGEAYRKVSDGDFFNSMDGVVHDHDAAMKDEAPPAYKDIRRVMRAQKDLVKVVHELRPMLSIKGR